MTAPARIEGYGRRDGAVAMDHPAEGSRRRVAASNGRDRDRGGHKPIHNSRCFDPPTGWR